MVLFGPKNRFLLNIKPVNYKISLPKPETKSTKLPANTHLNDMKILFKDQLIGPKSLAVGKDGKLYTGTYGGQVWELTDDKVAKVHATIADGRPIGMRMDTSGRHLYFTDTNSGLYVSDLSDKSVTKLIGLEDTKGLDSRGRASKFFDDLVVVESGPRGVATAVYLTDVSRKFTLDYWSYVYLEPDPTGRVLKYDLVTRKVSVVLDHLWFPNGIEVNDERNALLINELAKRRVLKHYIAGPKTGVTEVLIDGLCGEPDNIRRSLAKDETYWIGLALTRDSQQTTLCDRFSDKPTQRKLLLRGAYILGMCLETIGRTFGINSVTTYGQNLKTGLGLVLADLVKYPGMALEVDSEGNIVQSLQCSPDNKVSAVSEITEVANTDTNGRTLYIGGAGNTFVGKLTLKT